MIIKIIFTAAVILFVLVLVNKQRSTKAQGAKSSTRNKTLERSLYVFLALSLATGAAFYYLDWQEENSTLVVTVTNPNTNETHVYEIVKASLGSRSFRTTEGEFISLSSLDRMEIKEKE